MITVDYCQTRTLCSRDPMIHPMGLSFLAGPGYALTQLPYIPLIYRFLWLDPSNMIAKLEICTITRQ